MGDNMEEKLIGTYRGKKVIAIPDKECIKITLPQTLVDYILYLQNIEKEYHGQQLQHLFDN